MSLFGAVVKKGIKEIAIVAWKAIASEYLKKLYKSVPRQMAAVVTSKGAHTKYQWFYERFVSIFALKNELILRVKIYWRRLKNESH